MIEFGGCDENGYREIRLVSELDDAPEGTLIQWYIDGAPFGGPMLPGEYIAKVPGDGQVHYIELHIVGFEGGADAERVKFPSCERETVEADIRQVLFGDECDGEGNRPIQLVPQIAPAEAAENVIVQWYIDGQPVGQPGPPEPVVDSMPGDGAVHLVELRVLEPENGRGDTEQFEVPACDSEPLRVSIKNVDFADCDEEGNRPLRVLLHLEPADATDVVVQWYIDGRPVGQTGAPGALMESIPGDGGVHQVEVRVLSPEGAAGDTASVTVPDCSHDVGGRITSVDFGDRQEDGRTPIRLVSTIEPIDVQAIVQWSIDGELLGGPAPIGVHTSSVLISGGVHQVELEVLDPSGVQGEVKQVELPEPRVEARIAVAAFGEAEHYGAQADELLRLPVVDRFHLTPCSGDILAWADDETESRSWDVDLFVPSIHGNTLRVRHVDRVTTSLPFFMVPDDNFGLTGDSTILAMVRDGSSTSARSPLVQMRQDDDFTPQRNGPPWYKKRSWDCNDRRGYAWSISEYRPVGDHPNLCYYTFGSSVTSYYHLLTADQASDFGPAGAPPNMRLMPADQQYISLSGSIMQNPVWGIPKNIGPYSLDITDIQPAGHGPTEHSQLSYVIDYFEARARHVNGPQTQKIECWPAPSKIIAGSGTPGMDGWKAWYDALIAAVRKAMEGDVVGLPGVIDVLRDVPVGALSGGDHVFEGIDIFSPDRRRSTRLSPHEIGAEIVGEALGDSVSLMGIRHSRLQSPLIVALPPKQLPEHMSQKLDPSK